MTFGLSAFAQSPFASLGNALIAVSITETVAVDATAVCVYVGNPSIDESVEALDFLSTTADMFVSLNASVLASDEFTQLYGKFVYVVETSQINDAVSAAGSVYTADVPESLLPEDSVTGLNTISSLIQETVSATDEVTARHLLSCLINESTTPADVYTVTQRLVAFLNESVAAATSQTGNFIAHVNISESAAATATATGLNTISVVLTESSTPSVTQVARLALAASIIETTNAAEYITYTVDTKGIVTGVLIEVLLSSPLVWEQINDDQSANWTQINSNQSAGWVTIDDGTNTSWNQIKN